MAWYRVTAVPVSDPDASSYTLVTEADSAEQAIQDVARVLVVPDE